MTEFKFIEKQEYERGFAQVYDAEITPYLRDLETKRQESVARSKRWMLLAGAIAAFLAWQALKVDPLLPIFPICFGGAAVLILYLERSRKVQREMTNHLRPIVCKFFPDILYSDLHPGESFSTGTLRALNIIPTADKSSYGPTITGSWRDTRYRLTKASFYNERRDSDGDRKRDHLFSGIILEIECLIEMPTIVFYPDFGETMNKIYGWATRKKPAAAPVQPVRCRDGRIL